MSYRITLNRPPIIECDTLDEVLALADVAMQRVTSVEFTDPERERIELPATEIQPRITAAGAGAAKPATPKGTTKAISAYLRQKGKAARVSELCRELSIDEGRVRAALAGDEFLELGKGFFRLAEGNGAPPQTKRAQRPKAKTEPDADSDADDWEEPEPPRRKPEPAKPAQVQTDDLAERIRRVLAKEGAIGIVAIASCVDQPPSLVKDVLRSRPDMFRLHPRAGGWELLPS